VRYSKRSSSFDLLPALREPLYDESGRLVPIKGLVWRLNSVSGASLHALNWGLFPPVPAEIAEGLLAFMRHSVATKSNDHCTNTFRQLVRLAESYERNGDAGMRPFLLGWFAELRSSGSEWKFHYARDWYRWCFDQHLPGFDNDELLREISWLRIPGNKKGEAVLSEDPEEGPLDDLEEIALRAALHRDAGSLLERVLTWAFLSLGCNPKNLVYLWEQDYKSLVNGEHSFFTLDVPRIKKGAHPRLELKTRKLDASMAALFEQLIESNQRLNIPQGFARPLFARQTPRPDCVGTAIEEYAYHFTSRDLADIVTSYVSRLGVISHRTGRPLYVTPRRLRYRFATKKVQEGCPMEVLKELLDHSDLQNVIVYYTGASMTKRLDEALAVSVGPIVNRFMGRIVASETEAVNGGGRIKAQPMGRIRNVGSCGSKSLCTLFPPFSCYLCPLFQPWRDAPHREVLEDLVRQRDERIAAAGRDDDRIAKQYDEIIVTVGQVVALCEGGAK
jgi:hypothetical protein